MDISTGFYLVLDTFLIGQSYGWLSDNLRRPFAYIFDRTLEFLSNCLKKMTENCNEEIYEYVFKDVLVSSICCGQLVAMGETCHVAMVKNVFSLLENKANAAIGISRSKHLFDNCADVVAPPS
ncbi:hypothetical protein JRO89_XS06G0136600 [Xanthoceras sorbifolium]|uniref:Prolamin-like domain-containing protein n=1 Tax=Xanthoceras sorbifolium TaxID=99658 RepID=A0ABQ8HY33_9ROSI|nr:hypothetical protein JRO89_XS06G0136600 [Xanthoceras sorbifolium]